MPLRTHFGDQGHLKKQNTGVCLVTFLGWGPGGFWDAFWVLFGCFLAVFWMFCGSLLVAFWEPLGSGLLELLGSCGKDLGCFFLFSLLDFLYLSSQC